ncbi:GntP family permease [Aerococcaceae bacterium DSM 111176]|nr:GntP family permease [Aerococcaceae bacterium DSM 111176]
MTPELQMIVGLVIGTASLIYMLLKTKLHVFLALIITAFITGLVGGMEPGLVITAVQTGFGNTLGSLGILITLGVMLGKILEISGATDSIANFLIDLMGEGREHIALMVTGFIAALAIFAIPAYVMLFPIAQNIAVKKQIPLTKLGVSLAAGLFLSHNFVPPASAPIGAAGIFDANLVNVMLWGTILSLIMMVFFAFYAEYLGKRYNDIPDAETEFLDKASGKVLPSILASITPIGVPVILIVSNIVLQLAGLTGPVMTILGFAGDPMVAVGIGILVALVILTRDMTRETVQEAFNEGVRAGVNILLMVGAGGALGHVVNESGAGHFIAQTLAETAIPPILLPFIISTLLRIIQGSGSVAMVTAASISAPILAQLGIDPVLGTIAVGGGSVFFSYFNDSYFWVVNNSFDRRNVKEQIITWSIPSTVTWFITLIYLLILSQFI